MKAKKAPAPAETFNIMEIKKLSDNHLQYKDNNKSEIAVYLLLVVSTLFYVLLLTL